jgi:hypothetical protein
MGLSLSSSMFDAYIDFTIYRSGFTENYKRSFPTIDNMLGEIFGFVGLISLIIMILCSGYNRWLMKKYIK